MIFFGLYNAFHFLYRNKKYTSFVTWSIYVAALLCVALNMIYACYVPYESYCNIGWFLSAYGAAYCDLIVGICQAYTLSLLKI